METITLQVLKQEVYDEVAKATDYTGSKLPQSDDDARDRILIADDDLVNLGRFWDESVLATNENFKTLLVSSHNSDRAYQVSLEVSKSFDKQLTGSVESTLRSFFIASIIGQWFKFANKNEAADYFSQAAELLETADRLLYSRKKPTIPND